MSAIAVRRLLVSLLILGQVGLLSPALGRDMPAREDRTDVIAADLPAVVNISAIRGQETRPRVADAGGTGERTSRRRVHLYGSGFVIDPSGLIVTNRHVIEGAIDITVIFQDKSSAAARMVAASSGSDLALLKVNVGHPLPALTLADSDELRIGDPVIAIGNPLGVGTSVSAGIVSALNRDIHAGPFDDFIQTDAAVNHGNSGGPLIDRNGKVVGVNTAIYSNVENGGSIGLGFAIPSNIVRFVVDRLRRYGQVRASWIGAEAQDVSADIARALNLPAVQGAIVTGLAQGGPAAKAGLQEGDVVLTLDGKRVSDSRALMRDIGVLPLDSEVTLGVLRDGKKMEIRMPVAVYSEAEPRNASMMKAAAAQTKMSPSDLGLRLAALTDKARASYHIAPEVTGAVVTGVDDDSAAADAGIAPGAVIVRAGDVKVTAPQDVQRALDEVRRKPSDFFLLLLDTGDSRRWVTLMLDSE